MGIPPLHRSYAQNLTKSDHPLRNSFPQISQQTSDNNNLTFTDIHLTPKLRRNPLMFNIVDTLTLF
jgi:hypothetical protein